MIRYAITGGELRKSVDDHDGKWLAKADQLTKALIGAKKFGKSPGIWSDIKPVFMELQANKCIFCERAFDDAEYGRITQDVEHFRPKSNVKTWMPESPALGESFASGEASETGYYWLAYDLSNYAAACKVCNTTLKSNYFPIAGVRGKAKATTAELLKSEKPYLCLPIGSGDTDPEDLLEFVGTVVRPRVKSGHKHLRGEVIIDFFKLNKRDQLHIERAEKIGLLAASLEKIDNNDEVQRWSDVRDALIADFSAHAGCCRAFLRRWKADNASAKRLAAAAMEIVATRRPPNP